MAPVSMALALFMSILIPGLGLVKTKGGVPHFMGYFTMGIVLVFVAFMTMGLGGIIGYPMLYFVGLMHTFFAVKAHNREAMGDLARSQEMADLKDQIGNLQG